MDKMRGERVIISVFVRTQSMKTVSAEEEGLKNGKILST